ncbi:Abi family protein [Niabella ginsengisoli]|uniref:Abi family protein n=1 Tax=Niabella ginsengisoli TaxID=522298 RepID=A0ABS9SG26_9BACT|nr:Abi family protein [Niabella ginsengisoli]MCH5597311.1 Abi family protein [Niabella ginsengisoli]
MYTKPPYTIDEQIEQLKQRGLLIDPKDDIVTILSNISYYRLAGYWWPMQSDKDKHIFKSGSKFSDVMALYIFDRELRILLFDVIEKIEISLRTKLVYYLSHEFDPWWFQNTALFTNVKELVQTLATLEEEIDRSKDTFIKEHKKKYKDDLRFPPAWKSLELTSFGGLSKLYGNLRPDIKSKDKIAADFGTVNHTFLPSWLQSITQIRNHCAHHSRLWNRNLPGKPKLLPKPPNAWIKDVPKENEYHMIYVHLCCMKYLLNTIQPRNNFSGQIRSLVDRFASNVDPKALGLKPEWQSEPLWQDSL